MRCSAHGDRSAPPCGSFPPHWRAWSAGYAPRSCRCRGLLGQRGAGKYADAFFADVLAQLENGTPLPDGWRKAAARTPLGEREQAVLSGLADALGGRRTRCSAPCARRRRRCAARS
ncbi:MAG: hypothetical protein ACLSHJ_01480 [Oscillospiraceae bacterium]